MAMASCRRPFVSLVVLLLCMSLCGGCSRDFTYHKIFAAGLIGAGVGAIIGHQSEEDGEGAALGAAVFATGELLHQIDQINKEKKMEEAAEEVARGDSLLDSMQWEQ